MAEEYYAYATGNREKHFGLQYDAYGVFAFKTKEKAQEDAEKIRRFVGGDLESIIIDITPLVQTGIIPKEKLRIRD